MGAYQSVPQVFSVLRILRVVRISRLFMIIQRFQELKYLLSQIAAAFRAIFWGVMMIVLIMLMWSCISVILVHPITRGFVDSGREDDYDERLPTAFASVWDAMVTYTGTLFLGELGFVATPIVEENMWTYWIFLSASATVTLCAMNLILAAIVDSGAKTREEANFIRAAKEREAKAAEEKRKKREIVEILRNLDSDESGFLSKGELLDGFEKNPQFRK